MVSADNTTDGGLMTTRERPAADPTTLPLRDWAPRSQVRTDEHVVERSFVACIDVHNHLGRWLTPDHSWMTPDVPAVIDVLDACNVATVVNLDGRWGDELRENIERYDAAHPGRFVTFAQLDWSVLADLGDAAAVNLLVRSVADAATAGARGFKVWKDLGLSFRDPRGELVLPDAPQVAAVLEAAGEHDLPVLIHTADPVAFFDPLDRHNERLEELAVSPDWWFGGPGLPTFARLMEALESAVAAHPATTFIGAHVGCYAEDLRWVDRMLTTYPNFHVDTGGRVPELGRQPRAFRRLVEAHPDQVLFGTDGYPLDAATYATYFRFVETEDEAFAYAPGEEAPPMGRWDISAAGLPAALLDGFYADNAKRLLGL
jgi:predicted TIM-barrel fold metal-dependent hydrolase